MDGDRHDLRMGIGAPDRPDRPMRGGIAVVGDQALAGRTVGPVDRGRALAPELERILEVREGQRGMGARESGIEADRLLEEALTLLVVVAGEAIHVPEPAM